MAQIYNSDLTKEIIDSAYLKVGSDTVPSTLGNQVIPVMEVNPNLLKNCNIVKYVANQTINSSATIYTVPSDKDFYLCGFNLSVVNGATSQSAETNINIIQDNDTSSTKIAHLLNLTGVASFITSSNDFNRPIKLKASSVISLTILGTAVGASYAAGTIWGYTIENKSNN